MRGMIQYIPKDEVEKYLLAGWQVAYTLDGTNHGEYSAVAYKPDIHHYSWTFTDDGTLVFAVGHECYRRRLDDKALLGLMEDVAKAIRKRLNGA